MPPRIENETKVRRTLKSALAYARGRVQYADLLYERVVRIELQQLPDRLIPKPFNAKSRVQLRLLDRGRKAEVKVGTLDLDSIRHAVDSGVKLLRASPAPEKPVRLVPIPNPKRVRYGFAAPGVFPAAAVFDALVAGISDIARRTAKKHAGLEVKPEFWFFSQREEKAIADTAGVFKTQVYPRTFLQVFVRVRDAGGKMTQVRARLGECRPYTNIVARGRSGRLALTPATRRFLVDWFEKAAALQDAITLSAEEVKRLEHLILHANACGVFVHEALGHNFEADIVKAGASGIIDRDGEPRGEVASADVNIMDGPLAGDYRHGFGSEMIDDEGVEVRSKLLAENGRAVGMILNRETAAYFGKEPNGGAFSEMGDARIPRMSNTYLAPASKKSWRKDLKALVADVRRGIVLIGTNGGAVSKDGMSSSVQFGYLVENGRVTKMVKPANFSAKTLHALRYVDAFAGPIDISDVGFCGKGQSRYVGDGAPTWTRLRANEYVDLSVEG